MRHFDWLGLEQVLQDELVQSKQEGRDIKQYEIQVEEALSLSRHRSDDGRAHGERFEDPQSGRLKALYRAIMEAPPRPDFPYSEPSSLDEIRIARPTTSGRNRGRKRTLGRQELFDGVYGAWLGRCAGCLLGKPVEGMTSEQIEALLKWKRRWPLRDYVRREGGLPVGFVMDPEQRKRYESSVFENVCGMLRDDDLDYTIIGLRVLEEHGLSFTPKDVGSVWLESLPLLMTYTAERVAYRNLAMGLEPPESAVVLNPYREWIGAQIRADIWGYVSPGDPTRAAELAFRDAVVSHQKNGVYGEMFVAAAVASALATHDVRSAIADGLAQIPEHSRLAEAIRNVMKWAEEEPDWSGVQRRILSQYGGYDWFHTIPNAAIVVMALLMGREDLERSITTAVMAGLDTDCNGATVGSIVGAVVGASRLPSKWIEPLRDTVATAIVGTPSLSIRGLAERTVRIAELG